MVICSLLSYKKHEPSKLRKIKKFSSTMYIFRPYLYDGLLRFVSNIVLSNGNILSEFSCYMYEETDLEDENLLLEFTSFIGSEEFHFLAKNIIN
jgi:hypothetical protein